ncbi:acyltransferase [Holdemania massiliensis]|uniref:acyltransferase n=1 Tax=Holdemania massiliensis TaxID=1468449 RepID=UPI001F05F2F0|nr:acyltransferase [Holdemania massiliensis]MCH1941115.1 acyltransferase [Holdemania massiliensis]
MIIGRIINNLRRAYYTKKFAKCSADLRFSPENSILTYPTIIVGKNVFINAHAYMSGDIVIGDDVLIGPNCFFTSTDHEYVNVGQFINSQERRASKPITIDNDVWIGSHVSLMPGVHIHEGVVIGADSMVLQSIPPYCVCIGKPCRPIKIRYSDAELRQHYKILGKSVDEADKVIKLRKLMLLEMGKGCLLH